MMLKRVLQILLLAGIAMFGPAAGPARAAENPLVGEWKLDPARTRIPDEMKIESKGANTYAFDFGGGVETIAVDGRDHPGYGATLLSVKPDGRRGWTVERKQDGRLLLRARWKLSKDGLRLTDLFRGFQSDGSVLSIDYVYRRAKAGSGLAGDWRSIRETMNSPYSLRVTQFEGDGLSFISPATHVTKSVRFDGKDYPKQGPGLGPDASASIRRVDERRLVLTDKMAGKVSDTQEIGLSADGRTLTMTVRVPGRKEPNVVVFNRTSGGAAHLTYGEASAAPPLSARQLVLAGVDAQGGRDALEHIAAVQVEAVGYRNMLEQSERPEGPYIPQFLRNVELRDHKAEQFRETASFTVYPDGKQEVGGTSTIVVAHGVAMRLQKDKAGPADGVQLQIARERLSLSPERLLLTALAAGDLRIRGTVIMQRLKQDVVSFTLDHSPVVIYLNPYTHLPTAYDYSGPLARTGFWAYTGDATQRTFLSFWTLTDQHVRMPLQADVVTNGLPDRTYMFAKLVLNPPIAADAFAIPTDVAAHFRPDASQDLETLPLGIPSAPAKEIAPGVVFIPGRWNVILVRQPDGVVVLEAPISSGYSAKVIEEAHRRFPNVPVKAVVTTSDAWPHIAGLREYTARGVPIYALDLNRFAVERILTSPHTSTPDRLQQFPKKASLHTISGPFVLGEGDNRLEMYPVRGESSERQMAVFLPEHRLLYGSDIFQQDDSGRFAEPEGVLELQEAIVRYRLPVDTLVMMHVDPAPWANAKAPIWPGSVSPNAPAGKP